MNRVKTTMFVLAFMITFTIVQTVYANIDTNRIMADRYSIEENYPKVTTTYIGEFEITFYCNCEKCCGKWAYGACKNGEMPKDEYTIAVDTNVIELNTWVYIDGIGLRKACDTGSGIKGNKIDVFVSSHNKCLELGRKSDIQVWEKEWIY